MMSDPRNTRKSVSRFLQIIQFADRTDPAIQPIVEQAFVYGREACLQIGDREQAKRFVDDYTRQFPNGDFLAACRALGIAARK